MKDIKLIRKAIKLIQKHRDIYVEDEAIDGGQAIFICNAGPIIDDQQSIHMMFSFDKDGDIIQIG